MKPRAKPGMLAAFGPAVLAASTGVLLLVVTAGYLVRREGKPQISIRTAVSTLPATRPVVNLAVVNFHKTVQPILQERCYACHSGEDNHTGVAFDTLKTDDSIAKNPELWLKVLRNTRSHVMPPVGQDPPTPDEQAALENWIEYSAFSVDLNHLDPGRQTIRRLNRSEYRNTITDLTGVDFDTDTQFPADDIGYGFDNIGDILNVSPMLMEKYMSAAQTIVSQAVPMSARTMPVQSFPGNKFADGSGNGGGNGNGNGNGGPRNGGSLDLSFLKEGKATHTFNVATEGDYHLIIDKEVRGGFNFTPDRCIVVFSNDDQELSNSVYVWKDGLGSTQQFDIHWAAGPHHLTVAVHPTTPSSTRPAAPTFRNAAPQAPSAFRILKVQLQGPLDENKWSPTPGYARIFPRGEAPRDPDQRRDYATEILRSFATKAFRHPVRQETLDRLVDISQNVADAAGGTFEKGIAQSMVAILASPRFIYRVETPAVGGTDEDFVNVNEYDLASRLSYFLWSTMPDDELFKLAAAGELRKNLPAQVKRMLADPRSHALVENFTGQWLQSREVDGVSISPHEVQLREGVSVPFNTQIAAPVRAAMKEEPEAYFNYILQNDRSVNEFVESDYTFLNQALADFYKMPAIGGPQMRKVTLPAGDLRGGALTMGATLMVTSNPTRTSPVKRGKWVLENILGAPTPPPPPDIPPLELAAKNMTDKKPTLRQILAAHRANPLCASCHDRMDPLGLAMENFNAEGQFRKQELDQPIDASGQLFTGEKFNNVSELKRALVKNHLPEFYHCLTEKMMIYATGRGMEYYDMPTIDKIVERLDHENGRLSALLLGVIDSAPFQEQRVIKQ